MPTSRTPSLHVAAEWTSHSLLAGSETSCNRAWKRHGEILCASGYDLEATRVRYEPDEQKDELLNEGLDRTRRRGVQATLEARNG